MVSLGGDGTMLRALRLVQPHGVPVLGVNVGRLGFLAELDVPELPAALGAVDEGRYTIEPRVAVHAHFGDVVALAFNDIALFRFPGKPVAAVELRVGSHRFVRYAADAVIVATPTGSTAYSFSAGGPIVSPQVEGLLVMPVASHSAFNRAVLLSRGETIELDLLESSGPLAVEVDGTVAGTVGPAWARPRSTSGPAASSGSPTRPSWTAWCGPPHRARKRTQAGNEPRPGFVASGRGS